MRGMVRPDVEDGKNIDVDVRKAPAGERTKIAHEVVSVVPADIILQLVDNSTEPIWLYNSALAMIGSAQAICQTSKAGMWTWKKMTFRGSAMMNMVLVYRQIALLTLPQGRQLTDSKVSLTFAQISTALFLPQILYQYGSKVAAYRMCARSGTFGIRLPL